MFIDRLLSTKHKSIHNVFVSDLVRVSNKLLSKKLITSQTNTHVTRDDTPDDRKAHRLAWECHSSVRLDPDSESRLHVMLDVLRSVEPDGPDLAKEILEVSANSGGQQKAILSPFPFDSAWKAGSLRQSLILYCDPSLSIQSLSISLSFGLCTSLSTSLIQSQLTLNPKHLVSCNIYF